MGTTEASLFHGVSEKSFFAPDRLTSFTRYKQACKHRYIIALTNTEGERILTKSAGIWGKAMDKRARSSS